MLAEAQQTQTQAASRWLQALKMVFFALQSFGSQLQLKLWVLINPGSHAQLTQTICCSCATVCWQPGGGVNQLNQLQH